MSDERALTIKQPYASLIMSGVKDVENRSWPVPSTLPPFCVANHSQPVPRGDDFTDDPQPCRCVPFPFLLWIHAGKTYDDAAYLRWYHDPDWSHTALPSPMPPSHPTREYPRGVLLGSVLVTGCHPWEDCIAGTAPQGAQGCSPWAEDDAYHWTLADPQPLPEPIPMKGRQGLWRVPHNVEGFLVGSSVRDTPSTSTD